MNKSIHLFAITGGPGCGKTTIIEELKKRNYHCVDEVAREIIKEQVKSNGNALPWADKEKFTSLMLEYSIESYIENKDNAFITFFDRGIPDTLAYANLIGLKPYTQLSEAVKKYRYNPIAFILPPWEEIYQTDTERKQSFQEAIDTYKAITNTYNDCGYQLIEVPKLEAKDRVDFILSSINNLLI
ncbi:AAA family ATPase [Flavobacterium hydatis]|uniref:ATPase n=1 Tax=Flavobacterium hydatis TaxID=991 RepID=A0A086AP03_FLAHY|nr:AAA family ATPase [Flavobacterium hydatis]KFF18417.1 ATPase [Flavobacterium hydatis]OXA96834.1 ATPase [Flavobacterium hydatis]